MATALDKITAVSFSGKDLQHPVRAKNIASTGYQSPGTIMRVGEAFSLHELNERTPLNFTTPVGVMSGLLVSYFFYLGKRGFNDRHRMEEWMEISPVNAQYYQITIQQKQELERHIKEGLASITQAMGDLELLEHDLRRYKEYMDYFELLAEGEFLIKKGKKEEGEEKKMQAEQTLKAIFIDLVDVHTDLPQTPIALRTIVQRWPTIIADFMRMEEGDTDPKKIAKKLEVSEAEGVVLATKNKLYNEWKKSFKATVGGRYERILGLVEARKKSFTEYRRMLEPYITRYRSIREYGETAEGRRELEAAAFFRHGAQAISVDYSMTWLWRSFRPSDFYKTSLEAEALQPRDVLRSPIFGGFKSMAKGNMKLLEKAGLAEISTATVGVEPLDRFVYYAYPYIEEKYGIKFTIADILDVREKFCKKQYEYPYFETMEVGFSRIVSKLGDGTQFEDVILDPFWCMMDTANVILLRMLEVKAKETELENYIMQMLGETGEKGKKIKELMEESFPHLSGIAEKREKKEWFEWKYRDEEKEKASSANKAAKKIAKFLDDVGINTAVKFFKPGPYETHVEDVITGIWVPEFAGSIQIPSINFFKDALGVPGAKASYR